MPSIYIEKDGKGWSQDFLIKSPKLCDIDSLSREQPDHYLVNLNITLILKLKNNFITDQIMGIK